MCAATFQCFPNMHEMARILHKVFAYDTTTVNNIILSRHSKRRFTANKAAILNMTSATRDTTVCYDKNHGVYISKKPIKRDLIIFNYISPFYIALRRTMFASNVTPAITTTRSIFFMSSVYR